MRVDDDIVLFAGAGASLPEPAGGPLFADLRDACARRAGVDPHRWESSAPDGRSFRDTLLARIIPEVFLKQFVEAGFDLEPVLADAVAGVPGTGPNLVHHFAADVVAAGGAVWTVNWDQWIESAYRAVHGPCEPAVAPRDPPPVTGLRIGKLHGSVDDTSTLRFTSSQVLQPLDESWSQVIVESCRGARVCIVGYGGADVDVFDSIGEAFAVADAVYWFEGVGGERFEDHPSAADVMWRFDLDGPVDPTALPDRGTHLVWCGEGSSSNSPSAAILEVFARPGPVAVGSREKRAAAVDGAVADVVQQAPNLGRRLRLAASINERLGYRASAGFRHVAVLFVGRSEDRRHSARALGHLVLLRARPWRDLASRVFAAVWPDRDRAEFIAIQSGRIRHDPDAADRVASSRLDVTVDRALDIAMATRWAGDLRTAEQIARKQFERAMEYDRTDDVRDWPERVSRASFEIAQALIWQGRLDDADDECRRYYMRVSGAKWSAWELAMRAVVRFAHGNYELAAEQFAVCEEILCGEGFEDFAVSAQIGRAACARMRRRLGEADALLTRIVARRHLGVGSTAALWAEQAEFAEAVGRHDDAVTRWRQLCDIELPLWCAIGHLRLAESGIDQVRNAQTAIHGFDSIGSDWGSIRGRALINNWTADDIAAKTVAIGPPSMFNPHAPWLM